MKGLNRREFAAAAGGAGLAAIGSVAFGAQVRAQGRPKVVVIGGGAGGATVANHVKRAAPAIDVMLIEPQRYYTSCFYSNLYLGGFRTLDSLTHDYDGLRKLGVVVVADVATDVDTQKKWVKLKRGRQISYDRLVLSPGIDLKFSAIAGYSEAASEIMPHAWKPGAQTKLLKLKLNTMPNGGVVVLAPPPNPYRCPPGPYERACMIAHFLKTKKPKSKLIVFDPKKTFSKEAAFIDAFQRYYKDIVEMNLSNELDDFSIERVDPKSGEVVTRAGRRQKADVANIVPPQRAGDIAVKAGCTEGDWCPVNLDTFASAKVKDVYVLGDAAVAADMPKSAFSANSQAKVVAADILADLAKQGRHPARYHNICWSMVAPDDSIKIGADYAPGDLNGKRLLVASESFVSQPGEQATLRKENYEESLAWYDGICADIFAEPMKRRT